MKKYAFTMAEILISLTIIGVIAALTLPALQANINESAWKAKKKALHSRMSQAIALMPALNGYGIGADDNETIQKAAQAFVTDGLSKVLKISNICDYSKLEKCNLPNKITTLDGRKRGLPDRIQFVGGYGLVDPNKNPVINTYAAAFETVNGESVLTFYNPYCTSKDIIYTEYSSGYNADHLHLKQHVCANFVFDLNGKKGPNRVGKDIGFMTALYSSDPDVVMAMPVKYFGWDARKSQTEANAVCKSVNSDYHLPNVNEALSISYNKNLGPDFERPELWTSDTVDTNRAWMINYYISSKMSWSKISPEPFMCIRRF